MIKDQERRLEEKTGEKNNNNNNNKQARYQSLERIAAHLQMMAG